MTKLFARNLQGQGIVEIPESKLSSGGEGSVHLVNSHDVSSLPQASELVAKIYFKPDEGQRDKKVAAMIVNPPHNDSLAWPLAILFNQNKKFVGFLMRKLESSNYRQWLELTNIKDRRNVSSDFDVRYALNSCKNLAVAIQSVHNEGNYLGDINESNIFVKDDSTVFIIDTDSAQIRGKGEIFPCEVGKPEYLAPELSNGGKLREKERTAASDTYAFGVAAFQMITGGSHPTDGIFVSDDDPPNVTEKIRQGILPGLDPSSAPQYKAVKRIPVDAIPSALRSIFIQTFSVSPEHRASLPQFIHTLDDVLNNLVQCSAVKQHWYDKRDGGCGWCAHVKNGQFDIWSPQKPVASVPNVSQSSLPSLSFQEASKKPLKAKRAAPVLPTQVQSAQSQSYQNSSQNPGPAATAYQNMMNNAPQQVSQPPQSQNVPSQNSNAAPQQKLPTKYKGKTILTYADGRREVRPALGVLFQNNPRIAIHCIKEETPSFAKAWWDNSRKLANPIGAHIGVLLAILISLSWLLVVPHAHNISYIANIPDSVYKDMTIFVLSILSTIIACIASLSLYFSALNDRRRTKKKFGSLDGFDKENAFITLLRFVPISIFYGPILVFCVIIGIILTILNNMFNAVMRSQR